MLNSLCLAGEKKRIIRFIITRYVNSALIAYIHNTIYKLQYSSSISDVYTLHYFDIWLHNRTHNLNVCDFFTVIFFFVLQFTLRTKTLLSIFVVINAHLCEVIFSTHRWLKQRTAFNLVAFFKEPRRRFSFLVTIVRNIFLQWNYTV